MVDPDDDDNGGPFDPYEPLAMSKCPTCKGRGTVNTLTAPAGFFCVDVMDCPRCDGTGEIV
jgi:DnaJ-class molecular chaperone